MKFSFLAVCFLAIISFTSCECGKKEQVNVNSLRFEIDSLKRELEKKMCRSKCSEDFISIVPTKNFFYAGLDNPFEIQTSYNLADLIVENQIGAEISRYSDCYNQYLIKKCKPGRVKIRILKPQGNDTVEVFSNTYKVRSMPQGTPNVSGYYDGDSITIKQISQAKRLMVFLVNQDVDLRYNVKSFSTCTYPNGQKIRIKSNSDSITTDQKKQFSNIKSGDCIYFEDILCLFPDSTIRLQNTMKLTLK